MMPLRRSAVADTRRSLATCRHPCMKSSRKYLPPQRPVSVTWALDMATSVPVPIALPTSAAASAGASLMPSPAMATLRPLAFSRSTSFALSWGRTSPCTTCQEHLAGSPDASGTCTACRRSVGDVDDVRLQEVRRARRDRGATSGCIQAHRPVLAGTVNGRYHRFRKLPVPGIDGATLWLNAVLRPWSPP